MLPFIVKLPVFHCVYLFYCIYLDPCGFMSHFSVTLTNEQRIQGTQVAILPLFKYIALFLTMCSFALSADCWINISVIIG